jgi:calcyclin binding protein
MITVLLRKKKSDTWACVTEKDFKVKEKNKPKLDESADPQESLMTMMKQMYEQGDDEMKRSISKAFVESREKQGRGDL